ncbi:MAG: insulinase family protein [Acidobacteria bacterium]|nr:insulinase family protein [Acidobacteriota bacterium]
MSKETKTPERIVKAEKMFVGRFLRSLVVALALVASSTHLAPAQTPAPASPKNATTSVVSAPDARKLDEVAATAESLVTEFEVNGLKVLVKRRAGSQTVAAGLFVRGGARNITAQNAGVEALMWDAATEATRNFPRAVLRKELARMGTNLGYGINFDYSALSLGTTRQNFDRSWEIFTDAALRPAFTPEDFDRVKSRLVIARGNVNDAPDSFLEVLQARVAYAGHPYMNEPGGTSETLSRLTLEDVRRFHQQSMQTSRLLLVLVGDLDAAQVKERVAAAFGKLPRGEYKAEAPPQFAFNAPSVELTPRLGLETNYVQGVFAAPPLTDPDIYPMRIASSLLNERIFVEVRVRRNLSYAPSAFLRDQGANLGGIYVTTDSGRTNEAVSVMLYQVSRLQREQADNSELTSQVSGYLTKHYIDQQTNGAQAGELARYELIGGGWRNSLHFIERLRAVTPADVQRVARKYMKNLRFVVLGDATKVDRNLFTVQVGG